VIADLTRSSPQIELMVPTALGTPGYWYTFDDGTGSMIPASGGPFARTPIAPACPLPVNYAACMSSVQPFSGWGAAMGFDFATSSINPDGGASQPAPYDVSAYKGIRFLGRARDPGLGSQLWVRFYDVNTDSVYRGAACIGSDAGACDIYPQAMVPLTGDWGWYEVDFSSLEQPAGGYPETGLDTRHALGIQFAGGGGGVSFDICVADIQFVRP
jgi:hypothetical protein